jgi:PPIC-type PPIASE domain
MRARMSRTRLLFGVVFLGLAALAISWGRHGSLSRATANPPVPLAGEAQPDSPTSPPVAGASTDYSHRVVAYIYGTIPITREELGEYLIARMGKDRLTKLVNKRIIEHVCQEKGIEVTPAEVDADLAETVKGLAVNKHDFVNHLLKNYQLTLYEWKEDVIKPRLLLTKLCRGRVQATEEDLQKAFEAYHGEKLKCRLIMWPPEEKSRVFMLYPKLRDSEEEFDRAARQQANPKLAASGGKIEAFGRHTTGNEKMEEAAFQLKPNEISEVIETPQGLVVIKCLEHVPPDGKTLEEVRDQLTQDVINRKISQVEIPKLFAQLREQADPKLFLKEGETEAELVREAERELQLANPKTQVPTAPPGN